MEGNSPDLNGVVAGYSVVLVKEHFALSLVQVESVEGSVRLCALARQTSVHVSEDCFVWVTIPDSPGHSLIECQVSDIDSSCSRVGGLRMVTMGARSEYSSLIPVVVVEPHVLDQESVGSGANNSVRA